MSALNQTMQKQGTSLIQTTPLVIGCFYGPFVQYCTVINTLIRVDAVVNNLQLIHREKAL